MKVYVAIAGDRANRILVLTLGPTGGLRELRARTDLLRGSVDRWLWGCEAPGTLLTAISILADATDSDEQAKALAPSFAQQVIEPLKAEGWVMSAEQVLHAVADAQAQVLAANKLSPRLALGSSADRPPSLATVGSDGRGAVKKSGQEDSIRLE